jgi:hypothetical protein
MNTASTPETVKGGPFGVIDPGHRYHLLTLDGPLDQRLQFVKRCDMERPESDPGNTNNYPGTTSELPAIGAYALGWRLRVQKRREPLSSRHFTSPGSHGTM